MTQNLFKYLCVKDLIPTYIFLKNVLYNYYINYKNNHS